MKIFIRVMGFTVIGMCVCLILMNLFDLNIRKNEVDEISRSAMNSTQIIMQENIEDEYYGTNNARRKIDSNALYEQLYLENLLILQTSNGKYNIDFKSDYQKGLLSVNINYEYQNFLGQKQVINKKLTNIIDVVVS